MKIVIDANIPLGKQFFSSVGDVIAVPPRDISHEHLRDADALVVRSVKKITGEMLKNTAVKFVGTCTAGFDHFETTAMQELGIGWTNAPGCNANAVVEYVFSVFSALALPWRDAQVGIIGCGNVGGRLHRRLKKLGVECRCYDPFLSDTNNEDLCPLETVLKSDIVCIHAPLSTSGPHPSFHLLNQQNLSDLKSGAVLINAGRGPVVDNKALLELLNQRQDIRCVLDVWEDEPNIPLALANRVDLATPHIAGHSYDGKVNGTEQIYQALCDFFKLRPAVKRSDLDPLPELPTIKISQQSGELEQAMLAAYDVRIDSQTLLKCLKAGEEPAQCFDRLRKNYPKRREFSCYAVDVEQANQKTTENLKTLGFKL